MHQDHPDRCCLAGRKNVKDLDRTYLISLKQNPHECLLERSMNGARQYMLVRKYTKYKLQTAP